MNFPFVFVGIEAAHGRLRLIMINEGRAAGGKRHLLIGFINRQKKNRCPFFFVFG